MTGREEPRSPPRGTDKEAAQLCGRARTLYGAPRLTVYGRLDELTRFGGSVVVDSGSGLGNLL